MSIQNRNLKGVVKNITKQGAHIEVIDENGEKKEYFAHLGDLRQNEELLYEIRDHKLTDLSSVYGHFAKLEKDQQVEFKEWDKSKGDKLHAFSVRAINKN